MNKFCFSTFFPPVRSNESKLHHQKQYSVCTFHVFSHVYPLFISFSVKCTSSDSSSPSSSCTQCPCLLNEWAVNPAPELKCCDQLYLLPHELQKGELWHATMGRTANIFQACCSKETVCLNNRCCSALDNWDRQESPLLKIWFGVTLVENL